MLGIGQNKRFHFGAVAVLKSHASRARLLRSVGMAETADEIMSRVTAKLVSNPQFRKVLDGWQIFPVVMDYHIEVSGPVATTRWIDDTEVRSK